ncbi:tetratricopeptide repeat-containing sensor histidine kinase [Pseudochryseolinea flava]|uniref:histidine kinase n=1 Tax=Pseudochryseolinea flava TaxID=2059302 RepID=A0A364Y4W6_9BACT|nr:tetratricopeptide repeat protein [Pseudochryseolinea flava]RAW01863.1 hypothetical protein DQQ10_09490 [Pseudochryseolinea flava]
MFPRGLLIVLLMIPTAAFSQRDKADSLEVFINNSHEDTIKVQLLNELVTIIRDRDARKAFPYARQARDLARVLGYNRGMGKALENLAWIHYRRGDYSRAFKLSTESLRIYESLNDRAGIANCYNHIAAFLYEQKQYTQAIENFTKAMEFSTSANDKATTARCFTNIAFTYISLEQYDSTIRYANRALVLGKLINNQYIVATATRSLGDVDLHFRRYEQAIQKYREVYSAATSLNNTFLLASVLHRMGKVYVERKQYDKALPYLLETLEVSKRYEHKDELERTCKLIVEVYMARNDLKKAFEYQVHYIQIHDSLNDQRNSEQVSLMQARFDSEMKETKIELLTKEAQLKQEEINSQRVWMYFYIGSLSLFVLLAFVLLFNYQVKKKANIRLEEKNAEIERQARELGSLNVAKDKLFSIISHDLRSPLSSLKGLMDLVIEGALSKDEFMPVAKNLKHTLESVQENLDNLLYWAQSQLKGLQVNPETFQVRSLVDEKIKLFHEISKAKNITIVNEIEDQLYVHADKNHIRLVFRNLIANAIKFSLSGGSILVRQRLVDGQVEISVSDSGVGMNARDVGKLFRPETHFTNPGTQKEKGIGIGLLLTKEFVEKNGGAIWVNSEIGKGSTFVFTLKRITVAVKREAVYSHSL